MNTQRVESAAVSASNGITWRRTRTPTVSAMITASIDARPSSDQ